MAFKLIMVSFNSIAMKRYNHVSVNSYCRQLLKHFGQDGVKRGFNTQCVNKFDKLGEKLEKQA